MSSRDAVAVLLGHPGSPLLSLNTHSPAPFLTVLPVTAVTCSPLLRTVFELLSCFAQQLRDWIAEAPGSSQLPGWTRPRPRLCLSKKSSSKTGQTEDHCHRHNLQMILRSSLFTFLHVWSEMHLTIDVSCFNWQCFLFLSNVLRMHLRLMVN